MTCTYDGFVNFISKSVLFDDVKAENKDLIPNLLLVIPDKNKVNFPEPSGVILFFRSKLVSSVCYVTDVHSCLM